MGNKFNVKSQFHGIKEQENAFETLKQALSSPPVLASEAMKKVHVTKETRGPCATMLTWVNSYKSSIQHFRLSVALATNQNEEFVQRL